MNVQSDAMRGLICIVVVIGTSAAAFSQAELIGRDQYPQFRGVSGLPGGGFPLRPNNQIGSRGALSLSTPVGYSLGHWEGYLGGSLLSTNGGIPPFSKSSGDPELLGGNGTFIAMLGFKAGDVGYLTVTNMTVSTLLDNTTNYHFRLNVGEQKLGLAFGIQDISGQIGSAGDVFVADDKRTSRSAYIVGTHQLADSSFFSAGIGTRRFSKPFFNASTWANDRLGFFAEHDGFNINAGATYMLGDIGFDVYGKKIQGILTFGTVRGKYPFWSIGVSF